VRQTRKAKDTHGFPCHAGTAICWESSPMLGVPTRTRTSSPVQCLGTTFLQYAGQHT